MDHSFSSNSCKYVSDKATIDKFCKLIEVKQKKLDEYLDEIREELEGQICPVTRDNAQAESVNNISRYHRWIVIKQDLKRKLNNLRVQLDKMDSQLSHYYKNNSDICDKIKSDTAAQRYIDGNKCRSTLREFVLNTEAAYEFANDAIKLIYNRGFMIKDVIDIWKIEFGLQ